MGSSLKSRPNYYQMLGLTPSATEGEINEAFARTMSLLPPPGAAAQVCIAYETLRNPVRRRDYDLSIGAKPPAQPQPTQLTIALSQQRWMPFVAADSSNAARRPAEPHVTAAPEPATREGPSQHSRLAESEKIRREFRRPAEPLLRRAGTSKSNTPTADDRAQIIRQRIERSLVQPNTRPIGLNRTGLTIGGVVLGVAILGAWAGTIAGNDVEAAQTEHSAPPALTKSKTPPPQNDGAPSTFAEATPQAPLTLPVAAPPAQMRQRASHAVERQTQRQSTVEQPAPAGLAVADAPGTATMAAMPLPNSVIARTIERIGYQCGEVASATAIEGEGQSVFRVNCTSGGSYQAKLVGGRYRFRRLG